MNLTIAIEPSQVTPGAEPLAGGTDLSERLRSGVTTADIVDISGLPDLDTITVADDGSTVVGALVTLERVGGSSRIRQHHPGLAAPAQTLATPQIRALATLGGSLCQRTRCWYYRHPVLRCFKNGGSTCPARDGDHHYGVAFDLGPCVHPHPSSVALGLLAYDATFDTTSRRGVPIADLYGDGSDPTRDHLLADGELLLRVTLPRPVPDERSAYVRLMGRQWAEWPLVECVASVAVTDGTVTRARVSAGAVANIPLRLPAVEHALIGRPADADTIATAAARATDQANPLDLTRSKLPLISATVHETLERALATP
jgi:xanthine dehydrogenase YagS FAD-binding subunit